MVQEDTAIRLRQVAYRHLALQLAGTIRHDGHGGVADDLDTLDGFADWLRLNADLLGDDVVSADAHTRDQVVELRRAVRSLFARAVRPGPPSSADAQRLLDPAVALGTLNAAAAVPRVPQLDWPEDGKPELRHDLPPVEPATRLVAALARAAIELLAGDTREQLRACPAPRCVRYFVKEHPRQEWCKPSCGNRARVSRYYQRQHESSG
jgi:predicted RNA-binding Zn ribbon-like protein